MKHLLTAFKGKIMTPETHITSKITSKNDFISSSINFIKKHKIILITIVSIITIITAVFMITPTVNVGDLKLVNLDTPISLNVGQSAQLKMSDVSVKLTHLANIDCPKNAKCFGSGQVVEYTLTVNGKKSVATNALTVINSSYQVKVISSDYKTYATVKIIKK